MQKYELFINPTTFFAKKHEIHFILCIINGFERSISKKNCTFAHVIELKSKIYGKGETKRN